VLIFYKGLVNLVYLLVSPFLFLKRRENRREWNLRCGLRLNEYLPIIVKGKSEGIRLWGHASSMGEVRVLYRLLEELLKRRPNMEIVISTYTKTGQDLAQKLFPKSVVFYFPLDAGRPLKRYFNFLQPDGAIMVETEIWPYFLDVCRRRNVPLVLANGRLSEKSSRHYKRFRRSLAPLLRSYRKFAVQTETDADRLLEIGADSDRLVVTGNIKHDIIDLEGRSKKRAGLRKELGLSDDDIFVIFASTRPGEEKIICRVLKQVETFPHKFKVMIAPRHLERLEEVKTELDVHAIGFVNFSDKDKNTWPDKRIILMDKMGFLADLFYAADLAFVGGTLVPLGGHNIMEPVLTGTPVLFGPSLENVSAAADRILSHNWGQLVRDEKELTSAINDFVSKSLLFKIEIPDGDNGRSPAQKTASIIIEAFGL